MVELKELIKLAYSVQVKAGQGSTKLTGDD
jgi:hypothetical protein